jgi:hypothetical protein
MQASLIFLLNFAMDFLSWFSARIDVFKQGGQQGNGRVVGRMLSRHRQMLLAMDCAKRLLK